MALHIPTPCQVLSNTSHHDTCVQWRNALNKICFSPQATDIPPVVTAPLSGIGIQKGNLFCNLVRYRTNNRHQHKHSGILP